MPYARCSQGSAGNEDVRLLDVMGELPHWYGAADAAFVGGSLVPVGGHNLLEPAALGKPVITGPHCFNSPDTARLLEEADALTTVTDAAQLAAALEMLFGNAELAAARGARAAAVVAANRGSAARALSLIRGSL
jgi:3-deoxy-D-manno-octulosonic-acid transferase